MNFEKTDIPDVILCKPDVFGDDRGYFMETFREDQLFDFLGYQINFCQDNESKSGRGVLRGLHFQKPPFMQTKLVRVIKGAVLDIAVDMRKGSPWFGKHISIELNETNKWQLLVPRGFAHGFAVLSEDAVFAYKCDNYYKPDYDSGVSFKDSELAIDWKLDTTSFKLSEKDKKLPDFKDAFHFDYNQNYYL